MKALEGNERIFEQRRSERGIVDKSAKDAAGSSGSGADKKR